MLRFLIIILALFFCSICIPTVGQTVNLQIKQPKDSIRRFDGNLKKDVAKTEKFLKKLGKKLSTFFNTKEKEKKGWMVSLKSMCKMLICYPV